MFHKVLIANRGEIACRIIQTLKRMGIKSIAIYSTPDEHARHVKLADESYHIGSASAQDSYLSIEKIIHLAKQINVDAIHPGYGFLSENADFAEACEQSNIVFIGPPVAAITAMGSKSQAKARMQQAHVPIIPGYHEADQSEKTLLQAARTIGFPILLKPALGGGGKGMRIVQREDEFSAALAASKREAKASFNDESLLIEKYLANPRHIEVQIFADQHGHVIHLFERDCSIQRRYQKIVEEAPAPHLDDTLRQNIGETAVKVAKAIHYVGAGTVEFLVDENHQFYFMEMNTRLQVEHPVTEMICGFDLVEWQLRVASGEALPITDQKKMKFSGHAIEARIYAENPQKNFLPATGTVDILQLPETSSFVRIDHSLQIDEKINPHYDPLLAKLIVWDRDRATAIRRLYTSLCEFHVFGVETNLAFLRRLTQHPEYQQAHLNIHFIHNTLPALIEYPTLSLDETLIIASLYALQQQQQHAEEYAIQSTDRYSPWYQTDAWKPNLANWQTLLWIQNGTHHLIKILNAQYVYQILLPNHRPITATCQYDSALHQLTVTINEHQMNAIIYEKYPLISIMVGEKSATIQQLDPEQQYETNAATTGQLLAPMPGTVIAVLVKQGETVTPGTPLLILEAMKMEHTVQAPISGIVKLLHYKVGDTVEEGAELLILDPHLPTEDVSDEKQRK